MSHVKEQTADYQLAALSPVLRAADSGNILLESLPVWLSAQTRKSAGRGRSADNTRQYGIQKLRELILELAVRGKLVPQDPSDETASLLLEKIAGEKALLIREGKIKKQKQTPKMEVREEVYQLPSGWVWSRLGAISFKLTDGSHNPPRNAGSGFPMLSSQNVNFGSIDFSNPSRFVTAGDFEKENQRTQIQPGDVLLTIVASLGRAAVVPYCAPKFTLQRSVAVISSCLVPEYLAKQLVSPSCLSYYDEHGKGTAQKGIYLGKLSLMPLAIPPLDEQHRIVKKVDELMALCDQLEQQQTDAVKAHDTLVKVLLDTLTQSENAEDFQQNWRRIAEHFDTLFTTESSIDQLKQTLLQLAVMGKLVPQDPNDQPASVLLKKIAEEKARLVKEGKVKKQKSPPETVDDENLFELPSGWAFCRLSNLIPQFQNGASSRGDSDGREVVVLRLADIKDWQISMADTRSIKISDKSIGRYLLQQGDTLIIRVNGSADIVGRFITCHENYDAIYCDHFIRMRFPIQCFSESYLSLLGSSETTRKRIKDLFVSTAGQKTVNQTHIGSLPVALPPLTEQHRIVKKVDELMALCDQLKDRLNQAQTLQQQLADSVVETALN